MMAESDHVPLHFRAHAGMATWSAALFASRHDGCVQPLAQAGRHFVDLVRAVDLDGLASGAEGDLAVIAGFQVLLQLRTQPRLDGVFEHIVEQGKKLGAGHFSNPFVHLELRLPACA